MTDPRVKRYEEELGPEALARQQEAARLYWHCCGELKVGPHHEKCPKYVPEVAPPVAPGQESLL